MVQTISYLQSKRYSYLNLIINLIYWAERRILLLIWKIKLQKNNLKIKDYFLYIQLVKKENRGNRKFSLNILNNEIIFKYNKEKHIIIQLPKLRSNYKKKLIQLEELSRNKQIPFTISLTSEHIFISYEEAEIEKIGGSNSSSWFKSQFYCRFLCKIKSIKFYTLNCLI